LTVLALLLVTALAVMALAACGRDETASGNEAVSSTAPIEHPSPTEAYDEGGAGSALGGDATRMAVSYSQAPYPPSGKAFSAGTVGWSFKPTVDIEVTELGCFDAYQDGLAHAHRVGIFDAHTGRLVASVTVGPKSALDGAFRWEEIRGKAVEVDGVTWHADSCVLVAGHAYVVGTRTNPGVEEAGAHETLYPEEGQSEEWAAEIVYGGLRTNLGSDTGFSAPTNPRQDFAWAQIAWMSPNFKFRAVGQDPTAW
jgi:hypothetical protein